MKHIASKQDAAQNITCRSHREKPKYQRGDTQMAATQLSARYSQDFRFELGGFVSQTKPPALEGTGVFAVGRSTHHLRQSFSWALVWSLDRIVESPADNTSTER